MANESLSAAKAAKNDEFYTQFYDIVAGEWKYKSLCTRRYTQETEISSSSPRSGRLYYC
jgi:hypothetical protein